MLFRSPRILLLSLATLLSCAAASAQTGRFTPPDTTEVAPYDLETSFKFYPIPIWSRSAGFSAGVGYEVENLIVPRTRILAMAWPGQHLGSYSLTYFVRDAYGDAFYGLANVYYETTGRQWYYGMNTTSSIDDEIAVEMDRLEAELRLGMQPFGGRFFVQPSVKYMRHEVYGYEEIDEGALARLAPGSRLYLFYAAGETAGAPDYQEGVRVGLAGGIDLRDRPARPRRGLLVQIGAHRNIFEGSPGVEFDLFEGYAYAYVPVRGNTLKLRGVMQITDSRSDAPIPFYLHPSLDGRLLPGYSRNRFYANDLIALTAEYALPIFQMEGFAAMDLLLSAGAGNVYADLFRGMKPAISFKSDLEDAERYPLRPSLGLGFNLQDYDPGGWDVRLLLGWGTEGIRLVHFGFVHDLRGIELRKR